MRPGFAAIGREPRAGADRALPRRLPAGVLRRRGHRGDRVPGAGAPAPRRVRDRGRRRRARRASSKPSTRSGRPRTQLAATTHALLETLRERGLKLGLVSNAFDPPRAPPPRPRRSSASRSGSTSRCSRPRSGGASRDPAIFERALEALGVAAGASALRRRHARDRPRRRGGARHAHVPGALVPGRRRPRRAEPDFRAFTQMDVLTAVTRLSGEWRLRFRKQQLGHKSSLAGA